MPASNPVTREKLIHSALIRSNQNTMELEYQRNGNVGSLTVDTSPEYLYRLNPQAQATWYRYRLDGCQVGYVNMDWLTNSDTGTVMSELADTDAIIFDLRNYPNGTLDLLSKFLFSERVHFANFRFPMWNFPGWTGAPEHYYVASGGLDTYDGRLIILFNEKTISQAEFIVMALERHPGAVKIGSQTQAADGNVKPIALPGGILVGMTAMGVYYPDGTHTQRIGIVPDLYITPTVEGIKNGVDEVLEAALDCESLLDPTWPANPQPKSAIYFDPEHNGHGFDLSYASNAQIIVNYTYREDGTPIWYLATGQTENGLFRLDDYSYAAYQYEHDSGEILQQVVDSAEFTLDFKAGQQQIECAIANPSSREFPASLDWQQKDQRTRWCPELYRFDVAEPLRNISGLWYAGENDAGWGMSVRMQGQVLFVVLYYHDQGGQPTWAIASGRVSTNWPDDGPAILDLFETSGYCFRCEKKPVETRLAGRIRLSLRKASHVISADNWATIEALAGDDSQPWLRNHSQLVLLSDPDS
jgi:hypothetical protein